MSKPNEKTAVDQPRADEKTKLAAVNKPIIVAGLIGLFITLVAFGFGARTRFYIDRHGVHLAPQEQQHLEHEFSETIEAVQINSANNRVEVKTGETVRLSADYHLVEPEFTVEDGVLKIKFEEDWQNMRWSLGFSWFLSESLTLTVPADLLERLEVENDNGSVRIDGVNAPVVKVENDNGSIWVGGLAADQLTVTNKNGRIELFDLTSETTEVRNNNGSIEGTNVSGRVTVDNDNGRIVFNGVDPAAYLWLKNDNGSIRVNDQRQSDRPYIQGDDEAANWLRATNDNGSIRVNTR